MTATLETKPQIDLSLLGIDNPFKKRYDNFIGGKFVPPVKGEYFPNVSPLIGQPFTEVARSSAEDVEKALDAAHAARESWGRTSVAERANILNTIADRMERSFPSSRPPRRSTTASRSARRRSPTFRWRSITSDTSRAASAPKRAASARSTTTRSLSITTSPSASSGRSFRGISRS